MKHTHGRRAVMVGALAGSLALVDGMAAGPAGAGAASGHPTHAARAVRAYRALQEYFYDEPTGFYLETYPRDGGNPWSYVWPFSQAMIATQDVAGLPVVGSPLQAGRQGPFRRTRGVLERRHRASRLRLLPAAAARPGRRQVL